jgi:hypothetical protein
MSFTQSLILAAVLLVGVVLVTINYFFWKNWCKRKDHVYRTCGLEREFELREQVAKGNQAFEIRRMELNHAQTMERDKAVREGSHSGVGGYS